jgi:hypothetical protein
VRHESREQPQGSRAGEPPEAFQISSGSTRRYFYFGSEPLLYGSPYFTGISEVSRREGSRLETGTVCTYIRFFEYDHQEMPIPCGFSYSAKYQTKVFIKGFYFDKTAGYSSELQDSVASF